MVVKICLFPLLRNKQAGVRPYSKYGCICACKGDDGNPYIHEKIITVETVLAHSCNVCMGFYPSHEKRPVILRPVMLEINIRV